MNYKKYFKDKTILITGGTGSFGNALTDTVLFFNPKKIIIFSRDEKKQEDMRNHYQSSLLRFVIGDVRDKEAVEIAVKGVDYIFHAAALKQVPTCEFFPLEAVKTNVLGASNVINAAIKYKVKRLVILSTDKAVYPINAMGMSKALMEKVMIASSKNTNTILCGVRYGNVLYSRGSVLPCFVSQIHKGEKLRITHPNMTRFLLMLGDAVDLVLYALIDGKKGYMYIRKSPACTLETLAKAMCKIFKYEKGYEEVGIRAGEKFHETLVSSEEIQRATDLKTYFAIPPESQGLDYNKYLPSEKKKHDNISIPFTSENAERLNVDQTEKLLLTVPEIQERFYVKP
ncbi:polysaccharide biosynthesis protein [Candidatus Microgenomates bacterium]|nr:polysaccharide biosynthesis protein [Candidatus Microgenomates bacterium]